MSAIGQIAKAGILVGGAFVAWRVGNVIWEDHKLAEKAKRDPLGLLGDTAKQMLQQAGTIIAPQGQPPPGHVPVAPPSVAPPQQVQALVNAGWGFFQNAAKMAVPQ